MKTVKLAIVRDSRAAKPGQIMEYEIAENTLREILLDMTNDTNLDGFLSSYGSFEAKYIYDEANRFGNIIDEKRMPIE